jgi:hypothetical protein
MKDFHIETKSYADRAFAYVGDRFISEMKKTDSAEGSNCVFNGSVPDTDGQIMVRILAYEGTLELNVGKTLSVPLTVNSSFEDNYVIVNDIDGSAEVCLVEFSSRFSRMTGVPREIELIRKAPGELKKEWKLNNKEMMARGIDPLSHNFISGVKLNPSDEALLVLKDLEEEIVIIKLYGADLECHLTV